MRNSPAPKLKSPILLSSQPPQKIVTAKLSIVFNTQGKISEVSNLNATNESDGPIKYWNQEKLFDTTNVTKLSNRSNINHG
jgi:hypothetical protein